MAADAHTLDLAGPVVLLAAGVIAAPLFKRLGLGSVLGYLGAGLMIGPSGLGVFDDPQTILHVAELGVVMLLFLIGLEMQPRRLWALRRDIFGLGLAQVGLATLLLSGTALAAGLPPAAAFVGAAGFVLSSTAVIIQVLEERGELHTPSGQRAVSVLLLEDLAIVPLLAIVALLGSRGEGGGEAVDLTGIGLALAALVGLFTVGRWLLNPVFRLLAAARAREVMTAAALLVVLGAALLMERSGLSMAMGAFLAGVLLSESSFRHQLEADIEPFRGILLGLFFLSVGMSLDLGLLQQQAALVLLGTLLFMLVKGVAIYAVARAFGSGKREALDRTVLFAQGGEFAFVLYAAAAAAGLFEAQVHGAMTAIVILSMALTPLIIAAWRRFAPARPGADSMRGVEVAEGLRGSVLIIGFGRFGQVASQALLARGVDITIIDRDTDMIRGAAGFGFKVYYGDGTRLDVLRASGAAEAKLIAVCVDDREAALKIVEQVRHAFPQAALRVRAFDREHALQLIARGATAPVRETFESALQFSAAALRALDIGEEEAEALIADIRRRDAERFAQELTGGFGAGRDLLLGNRALPAPLTPPRGAAQPLNDAATALTSPTA
jgi:glutathione-regulated potassium-efflux system protein KefB